MLTHKAVYYCVSESPPQQLLAAHHQYYRAFLDVDHHLCLLKPFILDKLIMSNALSVSSDAGPTESGGEPTGRVQS